MTIYVGIDPDSQGCMALTWATGSVVTHFQDLGGLTTTEVAGWLDEVNGTTQGVKVILERQQAMPRQGVSSTFKIGQRFGEFRGILAALGLPWVEVRAVEWKKAMGLSGKDKNAARAMAQQLFPKVSFERVKDHGRAEAFLLAEYGRRKAL